MTPTKMAATAAILAMLADIPLAKKYPLADSGVSLSTRVAVTGSLVFVSVWVAAALLGTSTE